MMLNNDGSPCGMQVQGDVLALHGIAVKLRAKRFGSGALRLDNTKLNFSLDADGNPDDAHPHGEPAHIEPRQHTTSARHSVRDVQIFPDVPSAQ